MKTKKAKKVEKVNTSSNIFDHFSVKGMPKVGEGYWSKHQGEYYVFAGVHKILKTNIIHQDGIVIGGEVVMTNPWDKTETGHHISLKEFLKNYEKYPYRY